MILVNTTIILFLDIEIHFTIIGIENKDKVMGIRILKHF